MNNENDEEAAYRQRSLLKSLWTEATSTTDLATPLNYRLHHRHSANPTTAATATSRRRSSGRTSHRHRVRREDRIAKHVWLSAFAAFAASILISIHVFLFRVLVGSIGNSNDSEGNLKYVREIVAAEDATMTLAEAHSHKLTSINLNSVDRSHYTIRINTWQRNEQLLLSVNHHAKCEGVKEIQVIWCDPNNKPPEEILHHQSGKVILENHAINSLNERFNVLIDTPTLGILSLDDDVLRPCVALDAAFLRWTRHPERMVGFDARIHVVVEADTKENLSERSKKSNWKYGFLSTTESSNQYSITLPRASFVHRDYLDLYYQALPRAAFAFVSQHLNCEDIAMSFLVSSLTDGKPPLLADQWAVKSMIKLYSPKTISGGGKVHKLIRDTCVDTFAERLGIKENGEWPLQTDKLVHSHSFFGYGAEPEDWSTFDKMTFETSRLQDVIEVMQTLQSATTKQQMAWLAQQKKDTMSEAKTVGMVAKTDEWKKRWGEN